EAERATTRLILLHHFRAKDIRWHQVRRELDAAAIEAKDDAKCLDQLGLCQTRNADKKRMAACQKRDQRALDYSFLTEDDLAGCLAHLGDIGQRGFRLCDHF